MALYSFLYSFHEPIDRRARAVFVVVAATLVSWLGGCATGPPAVQQFGAMRAVMREGRTEPRVELLDVAARPHAVAVGALAGLAGEITIVDGDAWVARVDGGDLKVTGPEPVAGDRATLLTVAHVARWQSIPVDRPAAGEDLESLIGRLAATHGIDTTAPFPFVIEGDVEDLDLHVINGFCPVATEPATVDAEPWRLTGARATGARLVGFFAPGASGTMTHHGSAIHVHAILSIDGRTVTGHVDHVVVAPGADLRVPARD